MEDFDVCKGSFAEIIIHYISNKDNKYTNKNEKLGGLCVFVGNLNNTHQNLFIPQRLHAGFKVIEMVISNMDNYSDDELLMMEAMQRRCEELIAEKPGNKQLFDRFLKKQQREFDRIQNELTCATLLLQKLPKH